MTESTTRRLPVALLTLRLGVFIVMIMWTLDKFVQPEHTAGVFANFYGLDGLGPSIFMVLGALQVVLVLAFLFGVAKRLSYGLVFCTASQRCRPTPSIWTPSTTCCSSPPGPCWPHASRFTICATRTP